MTTVIASQGWECSSVPLAWPASNQINYKQMTTCVVVPGDYNRKAGKISSIIGNSPQVYF